MIQNLIYPESAGAVTVNGTGSEHSRGQGTSDWSAGDCRRLGSDQTQSHCTHRTGKKEITDVT